MIVIKSSVVRKFLKIFLPFFAIPAVVLSGVFIFEEKRYAFVSLALVILSLLLFMVGFEKKQTGTRRLIIVAVMVAISVVGRFIPFLNPITAITVITAVYIGGEAGFLVGAMSAVVSNFYFGQGPWTPFQMFAWGMIGLIAGLLSSQLKKSRVLMLVYGFFAGILYSFIMDVWVVLWNSGEFVAELYLAAIITAIPYTVLYLLSNMLFIWFFAKPFGNKLQRVKIKYGV